eukprot:1701762-Alexandrium_andersonii.AAC.1
MLGLKRACDHRRQELLAVNWPAPMSNRVAHGCASLSWGGHDAKGIPSWSLSAADFPRTEPEDFEAF